MTSSEAWQKYEEYKELYQKANAVKEALTGIKGVMEQSDTFFEMAKTEIGSCYEAVNSANIVLASFNQYYDLLSGNKKTIDDAMNNINDYKSDVSTAITKVDDDLETYQSQCKYYYDLFYELIDKEAM